MKNLNTIFFLVLVAALCPCLKAQDRLEGMVERLKTFGIKLPQEQVFVHLDNSSYYLGDTLYYKAYVKRSDNGRPTNLSGILYCELLNNDGYLVERQMVSLENGEGHGNFSLADTLLYAGYYELRAYTKWQLNWGVTEQPHSQWAEKYFFSKAMAKDYYRDYEKLYSRVFPVYDKPLSPGNYGTDMTLRPLAAYFKDPSESPKTIIQFFPEGGSLVAGTRQRVAWEARNEVGKALNGTLSISLPNGQLITSETIDRGRGIFEITVPENQTLMAQFTPSDNKDNPAGTLTAIEQLPDAEKDGVALNVNTDTAGITVTYQLSGLAKKDSLGLTIMHNGILQHFCHLNGEPVDVYAGEAGIYQITVFNADGRVYADRLCFFLPSGFKGSNINISGVKKGHYNAFDPVSIDIQGTPGASLSVSVRDAAKSEYTYDTGTMLTEALLSSQIRGFVPHPQWYFQEDSENRRQALDLLLMVQGWRKYSWREMAIAGEFDIKYMPENRYPHWTGQIHNYSAEQVLNTIEQGTLSFADNSQNTMASDTEDTQESSNDGDNEQSEEEQREDHSDKENDRFNKDENKLKHPVALHAEFSQPDTEGVLGEIRSQGEFSMDFPRYYGEFFFFLGASDTAKWKKDKAPIWTQSGKSKRDEVEFPEFYVKIDPFYPRFPKPYDYYQSHVAPMPKDNPLYNSADEQVRMLSEVTIGARRNGRRKFSHWKPAFIIDAYEAFNATCDAGFAPGYFMGASRFGTDVARTYIGDMKTDRKYDVAYRFDGVQLTEKTAMQKRKTNTTKGTGMKPIPEDTYNMSDRTRDKYNYLWNLSDVVIYTDYSPRNDSQGKYKGNDLPSVTIDLQLLKNDEIRSYQKNRRWKMKGFSVPDEFYSPDYSKQPLPKDDHRRTLYWNPNVRLDENGCATISLFNNSTTSILQIRTEGWAPDGTPQCGNVN